MIHVYYRTSDNNNKKIKPPFITNENCLNNFIRCFNPESMQIIADNVNSETLDSLKTHGIEILQTKLGNPGSFKYALDLAIQRNNDDIIYLLSVLLLMAVLAGISIFCLHCELKLKKEINAIQAE